MRKLAFHSFSLGSDTNPARQLAVVVAAMLQHKAPLALGNVMGSSISNILGAFSLGLIFHRGPIDFDGSAKIYTAALFIVTTIFVGLAYFGQLNRLTAGVLMTIFVIYIISIGYAIYRGIAVPPELSDSDSDSCSESDLEGAPRYSRSIQRSLSETSVLLPTENDTASEIFDGSSPPFRGLVYHICQLLMGFVSLSLSGYILSHSASTIAESLHISGTVLGLTILSFATTLPEKFVAILSGSRGHSGIVVATTTGSNIFLLTLCMGVVALDMPKDKADTFVPFELGMTWLSSALFSAVVFLRLGRLAGFALLALYIVFLVLEFTLYRR